jgi:hypothetical protein
MAHQSLHELAFVLSALPMVVLSRKPHFVKETTKSIRVFGGLVGPLQYIDCGVSALAIRRLKQYDVMHPAVDLRPIKVPMNWHLTPN